MEEKNTEISARISDVIQYLGESPSSFAKKLGYKRVQTIYDILKGKSAPSYDFFNKFALTGFSVLINLRWLLTGIGEPLHKELYQQTFSPNWKEKQVKEEFQEKEVLKEAAPAEGIRDFLNALQEKDKIVISQAEEIGRLENEIEHLKKTQKFGRPDAEAAGVADVG